ncbi:hypothetical protein ACFO4N_15510 [Camelliibacillus cellulosilyticus]|uniref:Uncharacterized protein n=1 Tax=Camelliibacillus cellulosilyticus TaxID=2174486 RepID=A0ABV9GU06_9BACL
MFRYLAGGMAIVLVILIGIQQYTAMIPSIVLQIVLWLTCVLFIIHLVLKARKKRDKSAG